MGLVAVALPAAGAVTYLHAERIVWIRVAPGLEASAWTLRLYHEPDGYEQRLPYNSVLTASLLGAQAWLSGMHGQHDRSARRAIVEWLRSQGVTSAAMERRGRMVTLTDDAGAA